MSNVPIWVIFQNLVTFMAAMIRSIEPGRRKAYSVDLRWRVVWQRMALGLKYNEIATNLGISLGTAYNVIKFIRRLVQRLDARGRSKVWIIIMKCSLLVYSLTLPSCNLLN